jgi:pyruvate dehydrogenase E2 component (dihydrolipoamide acetyltransferase)
MLTLPSHLAPATGVFEHEEFLMPTEFTMPKLGLTMEEGTILEWLVAEGTSVAPGAAVLVVETDKVETEVEVPAGGSLALIGEVGKTYRCGELIGWILEPGESRPAQPGAPSSGAPASAAETNAPPVVAIAPASREASASSGSVSADGRLIASPFARRRAAELGVDITTVAGTGPGGRIVSEDIEAAKANGVSLQAAALPGSVVAAAAAAGSTSTSPARRGVAPPATFAAAELARLLGLDLAELPIRATAADGRVSRQDVADHVRSLLAASSPSSSAPAALAPSLPANASQEPTAVVPMKGMRGTIASRMKSSLADMAQLTLMMDANMDAVVADRNSRKAAATGAVPGYTDYIIAAAARALRDHPIVNSQIIASGVAQLPQVNVGMAVALTEGLVVPVVHNTDSLTLEVLSEQTTRLAEAARGGSLKLADLEGGTFSVTALGMFGVDGFTPVINPPNRDEVAWDSKGSIAKISMLTLSFTWDHRAFDGAPAAEFVATVCRYLDDPSTLS